MSSRSRANPWRSSSRRWSEPPSIHSLTVAAQQGSTFVAHTLGCGVWVVGCGLFAKLEL